MCMLLRRGVFLHVPKTGGSYVQRALTDLRLGWRVSAVTSHLTLSEVPERWRADKPAFCFVRHPVDWLVSYHAFARQRMASLSRETMDGARALIADVLGGPVAWDQFYPHLSGLAAEHGDFADFAGQVVSRYPGIVSGVFAAFADGCEHVGKQESLTEDLVRILDALGEYPDVTQLSHKRVNATGAKAEIPRRLRERIARAERQAMERWGYSV